MAKLNLLKNMAKFDLLYLYMLKIFWNIFKFDLPQVYIGII